jgi:hypothetical protein
MGANLRPDHIREDMDVYLECEHEANPPVQSQSWLLAGRPVQADRRSGVITTHSSLVLQKVRRSSAGQYECVAHNQLGQSLSAPFMLRVQCKCIYASSFFFGLFSFLFAVSPEFLAFN